MRLNWIPNRTLNASHRALLAVRLKRRLDQCKRWCSTIDIENIREGTLGYIDSMRLRSRPCGHYRYSSIQAEPVLYASTYAALTRHLYRDLEELSRSERKDWITYIQSHQAEDGLFIDPLLGKAIWWEGKHLTLHCVMALAALGAVANFNFRFLEPFKDHQFVIDWLETRNWRTSPADVSNEIQNIAVLLQYTRDFQEEAWAEDSIQWLLRWLDKKQDPDSGLWGDKFESPVFLSQGVQTGYHLWLLYLYDDRRVEYVDEIINSVLRTQNTLGGYGVQLNSSACEDIDSIDPLSRFYSHSNGRKSAIESSLIQAVPWVLLNMNSDGGFVFRRMEAFTYGHERMSSAPEMSAMFPTWFRTLSLAYLGKVLPDSLPGHFNWQFLRCPGLQFWHE